MNLRKILGHRGERILGWRLRREKVGTVRAGNSFWGVNNTRRGGD